MKLSLLTCLAFLLLITLPGCSALTLPTIAPTLALPTEPLYPPDIPSEPVTATSTYAPTPTLAPDMPLWITNPVDHTILQVDPTTNRIAHVIETQGRPEVSVTGAGAVWVLDRENDWVLRVDPRKKEVTAVIRIPDGDAETLAANEQSVWVGVAGRINWDAVLPGQKDLWPSGYIFRIDPNTNELAERVHSEYPVSNLAVEGNTLWVVSKDSVGTMLQRMDLQTKELTPVSLTHLPEWYLLDDITVGGDLWFYSQAYSKIFRARVESPASSRVFAAIDLAQREPVGYADLLFSHHGLWAATTWGSVLHIDPHTNHLLGQVDLDLPLSSLLVSADSVWAFSQQAGQLFRVDPTIHQVTATIETGSQVQPTVVPSPTPRVVIWQPCPNSPTSRLKVGDLAYVNKEPPLANRIREEPNREAETIGYIGPGASMEIIEGPACEEGWVWWKIRNANVEGWTAEGDQETYWLVPLLP